MASQKAAWGMEVGAHAIKALRLERDGGFLRARLLELPRLMPQGEQRRVDLLRRRSELGYRIFIAALEDGSAPPWRPFWRTEPPRSTGR
ncbi:MAG: hypothetical protein IIA64_02435 [Planctomycetes bacterium]|nr:hypothetical protein [Planctomycetota bacterium]